ncbi:MAG: Rieske (2Fe-2S) protein [Acidimicrobiales bacterium]
MAVNTSLGEPAFVCQPSAGSFTALSAICTHQGCSVLWQQSAQHFQCPCHGARFGLDGSVQRGPARAPLQKLNVRRRGDRISTG